MTASRRRLGTIGFRTIVGLIRWTIVWLRAGPFVARRRRPGTVGIGTIAGLIWWTIVWLRCRPFVACRGRLGTIWFRTIVGLIRWAIVRRFIRLNRISVSRFTRSRSSRIVRWLIRLICWLARGTVRCTSRSCRTSGRRLFYCGPTRSLRWMDLLQFLARHRLPRM